VGAGGGDAYGTNVEGIGLEENLGPVGVALVLEEVESGLERIGSEDLGPLELGDALEGLPQLFIFDEDLHAQSHRRASVETPGGTQARRGVPLMALVCACVYLSLELFCHGDQHVLRAQHLAFEVHLAKEAEEGGSAAQGRPSISQESWLVAAPGRCGAARK
jgi:hypothetical protein